jgi:hypothetical protein
MRDARRSSDRRHVLARDLGAAKEFYGRRIGLEILLETDQFATFRCGGDSRLVVTKSSAGPADEATKASWRVDDIAGEGVLTHDAPPSDEPLRNARYGPEMRSSGALVAASGLICEAAHLDAAIPELVDAVFVGRAMLRDPYWPPRIRGEEPRRSSTTAHSYGPRRRLRSP